MAFSTAISIKLYYSAPNAAKRLNSPFRPNVSFPVPNGEPSAGFSGYTLSICCTVAARTSGPMISDGVVVSVMRVAIRSGELTPCGVANVPSSRFDPMSVGRRPCGVSCDGLSGSRPPGPSMTGA